MRELKARLSEYLELAARGEHLTVTDRGRPRAVLGPLPGGDNVARGIAEGWITAAQAPGPYRRRRRGPAPRSPSKT